jgi:hypothetical protein
MTPATRRIASERRVTANHVELDRFQFSGNLDVHTLAVYPMPGVRWSEPAAEGG